MSDGGGPARGQRGRAGLVAWVAGVTALAGLACTTLKDDLTECEKYKELMQACAQDAKGLDLAGLGDDAIEADTGMDTRIVCRKSGTETEELKALYGCYQDAIEANDCETGAGLFLIAQAMGECALAVQ